LDPKITIRVPKRALANARRYANSHNTTLARLISTYLEQLPTSSSEILDRAPIVRRLTGLLSPDLSAADSKEHLKQKYRG
jgi:hypothetical protein